MEEVLTQETPFWNIFSNIGDALRENIAGKVGGILGTLGRIGIGAIPVVGDVVDLYELFAGKNFFTQENLTIAARILAALGIIVGSGYAWRQMAKAVEKELSNIEIKFVSDNWDSITGKLGKNYEEFLDEIKFDKEAILKDGTYNNYKNRTTKEIEKSIRSYQRRIDEHIAKIENPTDKYPDFYKHSIEQQQADIIGWQEEIKTYTKDKTVMEYILKERGL